MLKPKKKITKRDLREDKLVSTYFKASEFFYNYKKYIGWAATGIIIVAIGIVIYINNLAADKEKATAALGRILPYFERGEYQTAIDGFPEKNVMGLKDVADNYGSTESGDLAKFYLADSYFFLGNYDEALRYFKSFDGSYPPLRASAIAGVASCYEAKGDHRKAGEYFEKAAATSTDALLSPEYLHHSARNYGQSGKKERAVELLKKLKKDYPNSTYAREADRLLALYSS